MSSANGGADEPACDDSAIASKARRKRRARSQKAARSPPPTWTVPCLDTPRLPCGYGRLPTDEPTVYSDIVYRDGRYVAVGIDPYFDANMSKRVAWMEATNGGENIPTGDDSLFVHEVRLISLLSRGADRARSADGGAKTPPPSPPPPPPPSPSSSPPPPREAGDGLSGSGKEAAAAANDEPAVRSDTPTGSGSKWCRFAWLGEPGSMERVGPLVGDAHRCSECHLELSAWKPGDTFLNQHAYYAQGGCAYLEETYTAERLKIEIGRERFRRGFVAHPNAIGPPAPAAWNLPAAAVPLTDGIYVTLDARLWCYVCGSSPGKHGWQCRRRTEELADVLRHTLGRLHFDP